MERSAIPRRCSLRYYCHRCNEEYENVLQELTCPRCSSEFVESLSDITQSALFDDVAYSDALNNLEQSRHIVDRVEDSLDDLTQTSTAGTQQAGTQQAGTEQAGTQQAGTQPVLNDLSFMTAGGRSRPPRARRGDHRSLMEQLVWMFGGAARGANVTGGAPFVLVGAPGDYVFGGEGLDAVVTHLLGQLENTGPPPLPRDQIESMPAIQITQEHIEDIISCSICWDNYILGETVSRLQCSHIFHLGCISPWLLLHATCPICRRELNIAQPTPPRASGIPTPPTSSSTANTARNLRENLPFSRVVVRRMIGHPRRRSNVNPPRSSTRSNTFTNPPPLEGWASLASFFSDDNITLSSSTTNLNSDRNRDREYMDIDYD